MIAVADCAGSGYTEVDILSKVGKLTQGPRRYQNNRNVLERRALALLRSKVVVVLYRSGSGVSSSAK